MTSGSTGKRRIGPINRVEGDLEIHLEIHDDVVSRAWVNSPLYRGFEQMMQGRKPNDSLVITPRICGICSVAQSVAAARALADLSGCSMPPNGHLATNLILGCENIADHLSHFYLFFMPDFTREEYGHLPQIDALRQRFAAQRGSAQQQMLPARARFLHLTGLLAGKWPHSLAIQPGGTTRPLDARERRKLLTIIGDFRWSLQQSLFGVELEQFAALGSRDELLDWAGQHADCDLARFVTLAEQLHLDQLGRGPGKYLCFGAYHLSEDPEHTVFSAGYHDGSPTPFGHLDITEDISHSHLHAQPAPAHPWQGVTEPDIDADDSYSWCKAPRYQSNVVEVGALARQLIDAHPLITDLQRHSGGGVSSRIVARMLEIARLVPLMEDWARALAIGEPCCSPHRIPDEATGAGLIEAARGSLGHWLSVRNGHILNYQIIAPTSWNFSPRDQQQRPGALEQALAGTPVGRLGGESAAIEHIIRSFDPCMVCTVH